MDDDIDIEEHDLMENPAVRNIFPDLSVLKKEIQSFEDGSVMVSEPMSPEISILDRVVFESDSCVDNETNIQYSTIDNQRQLNESTNTGKKIERKHDSESITIDDDYDDKSSLQFRPNVKFDSPVTNLQKTKVDSMYTRTYNNNNSTRQKSPNRLTVHSSTQQERQNVVKKYDEKDLSRTNKNVTKRKSIKENNFSLKHPVKRKATDNEKYVTSQNTESSKSMLNNIMVNIPENDLFRTKLIIGSKPNKSSVIVEDCKPKEKTVRLKVMLQDIGSYLNNSRRYCEYCHILFPNVRAYSIHKSKTHAPKNQSMQNKTLRKSSKFIECPLCHVTFSSKGNLARHKRNFHSSPKKSPSKTKTKAPSNAIPTTANSSVDKSQKQPDLHPCFHCETVFINRKALIDHLYKVLEPKEKNINPSIIDENEQIDDVSESNENADTNIKHAKEAKKEQKNEKINNNINTKKDKVVSRKEIINKKLRSGTKYKNKSKQLYRCPICSYYFYNLNLCVFHMLRKHDIKVPSNIKAVKFDPICKYCANYCSSMRPYNDHLHNKHSDKINKIIASTARKESKESTTKVEPQESVDAVPDILQGTEPTKYKSATKSIIFKCTKCDINFLSANDAMYHTKHMELLINWKCPTCNRIFKQRDDELHLKQHKCSEDLVALELNDTELTRVLYSCPKCAIHFTETKYLEHYPKCASETAESIYCKVCDTLIYIDDSDFHFYCHKHDNVKPSDFIVIEGDIILEKALAKSLSTDISKDPDKEVMVILTYCPTCECFINYMSTPRKVHLEAQCSHIVTYICKYCGLKITQNGIKRHRKLHRQRKQLKLQDFIFYELNSSKPIRPPIPVFPQCENCKVYFVSRVAISSHDCSEGDFLTCQICILKFSEAAFKLHMMFHKYTLNNDENTINTLEKSVTNCESLSMTSGVTAALPDVPDEILKILFQCDVCFITFTTYDLVVEHCQDHYARKQEQIIFKCNICHLKFERECYDVHEKLHKSESISLNSFKILRFDFRYFTSENDIWIKHIFGPLSSKEIEECLRESVYKYECRIKMEVIQEGPGHLSIYKCNKCTCFIDAQLVYKHVESSLCNKRRNHPCAHCGLPFISIASRINHEQVHEQPNIRLKSYKIILFNRDGDTALNNLIIMSKNLFILYQCRNCNGLVNKCQYDSHECKVQNLKKCAHCGLLVYGDELYKHESMHEHIYKFQDKHIKVVLIGNTIETASGLSSKLVPSFTGVICDYTFYQCVKCELCLENKELNHTCYERFTKKCKKCNLIFLKNKLLIHTVLHDKDLDFVRNNMNIIPFGDKKNTLNGTEQNVENEPDNTSNDNIVRIFKCSCGLHFVDEQSASSHKATCNPKIRISKQNCSKCELLFTPNDLFNHLLKHHGDKKRVYEFEIVHISKEVI